IISHLRASMDVAKRYAEISQANAKKIEGMGDPVAEVRKKYKADCPLAQADRQSVRPNLKPPYTTAAFIGEQNRALQAALRVKHARQSARRAAIAEATWANDR